MGEQAGVFRTFGEERVAAEATLVRTKCFSRFMQPKAYIASPLKAPADPQIGPGNCRDAPQEAI
jgi:hypothetical protein